jgi:hypothetical protein
MRRFGCSKRQPEATTRNGNRKGNRSGKWPKNAEGRFFISIVGESRDQSPGVGHRHIPGGVTGAAKAQLQPLASQVHTGGDTEAAAATTAAKALGKDALRVETACPNAGSTGAVNDDFASSAPTAARAAKAQNHIGADGQSSRDAESAVAAPAADALPDDTRRAVPGRNESLSRNSKLKLNLTTENVAYFQKTIDITDRAVKKYNESTEGK